MNNSKDYNEILKKIESLRENSSKESDNKIKSLSDVVKNIKNFQQDQYDCIIQQSKKRDSEKSFENYRVHKANKENRVLDLIKQNKPILKNLTPIKVHELLDHEYVLLTMNNGKVYHTWQPHTSTVDRNTMYFSDGREYVNGKLSNNKISNCKVSYIYMLESIKTTKQQEIEDTNFNILFILFLMFLAFMLIAFG